MRLHVERHRGSSESDPHGLTHHERLVANGLIAGRSHREIAADLGTTHKSVKTMAHQAYQKLGVKSQCELVAMLTGRAPDRLSGALGRLHSATQALLEPKSEELFEVFTARPAAAEAVAKRIDRMIATLVEVKAKVERAGSAARKPEEAA